MITRVYARNYRSIGEIDLELGALTALVGPNGSGKSNIADVLRFLADCVQAPLSFAVSQRQGFGAIQRLSADGSLEVMVGVEVRNEKGVGLWAFTLAPVAGGEGGFCVSGEQAVWRRGDAPEAWGRETLGELLRLDHNPVQMKAVELFELFTPVGIGFIRRRGFYFGLGVSRLNPDDGALLLPAVLDSGPAQSGPQDGVAQQATVSPPASSGLSPLADELRRLAVYSLFPNDLRTPRGPNPIKPMTMRGDNWASTLRSLDKEGGGSELLDALGRIVGDIDDYRVVQAGGFLIPEIRHGVDASGRERWLGAAQESDGTLRVAAILTAVLQEPAPSLLGFEEPELAVHPGALPVLFDFFKEATTRGQVLLTTHSPDLLDLLSIDDLRVVERRDGATAVSRVEGRQRELVRKRLMSASDLLHAEGLRPEGAGEDG